MWQTSGAKFFVNKNLGVYTNKFYTLATTGPANDQDRVSNASVNFCTTDALVINISGGRGHGALSNN